MPASFPRPPLDLSSPPRLTRGDRGVDLLCLRRSAGRHLRLWAAGLLAVCCALPASALDEVILKNGRHYLGTIIATTATTIVLAIDGGTVEFPRAIVVSPPYLGPAAPASDTTTTSSTPETTAIQDEASTHPLPDVGEALRRLGAFPWVAEIRQVPVLVTDQGRWQFLPSVSFWAADFFQLSIYGDPARPSAIEVSLHRPAPGAWEQKRRLLEYMLSLAPGLAADNRFDRLNLNGDQFTIGDLWFEVTAPDSAKTPGRWAVLLLHELSLNAARASYEDLQAVSELVPAATIDTSKPRSWQRGSWLPEELSWLRQAPGTAGGDSTDPNAPARNPAFTGLGGERIFVRAFVRERGKYVRASNDWTRDFAAAAR